MSVTREPQGHLDRSANLWFFSGATVVARDVAQATHETVTEECNEPDVT
jgi:hypothetical protein